jgi:hypothetical protein
MAGLDISSAGRLSFQCFSYVRDTDGERLNHTRWCEGYGRPEGIVSLQFFYLKNQFWQVQERQPLDDFHASRSHRWSHGAGTGKPHPLTQRPNIRTRRCMVYPCTRKDEGRTMV